MTKPGKTPKKKTKEKSPQRTEESEYPAMDEETYNRLLRNAIEHSKAELQQQLQQQHEEQLKAVEERLTKKFDDEVRELYVLQPVRERRVRLGQLAYVCQSNVGIGKTWLLYY